MADITQTWDLSPIYAGFDDGSYERDLARMQAGATDLIDIATTIPTSDATVETIVRFVDLWNEIADIREQLYSYAYAQFSTSTTDQRATRELNRIEELQLPVVRAITTFREAITGLDTQSLTDDERLSRYAFFLEEQLTQAKHQMTPDLEDLAADLSRSGADAWGRLQESVSSALDAEWNPQTGERKTVTALRALAFSSDRDVRKRAFELEIASWKSMEIPLAFAINGVKGSGTVLTDRRFWNSPLEPALNLSRISHATVDALIGAMKSSVPGFRAYFRKKAELLGVDRLRFYDLFAPIEVGVEAGVGSSSLSWSFDEARSFVVDQFSKFSRRLGEFADAAFEHRWIDASIRSGKVGGAYCTSFPRSRESRVLCNFDGSLSSLLTIAHELGHAYHHEVLKDAIHVDRQYPMTLAETASIFCELIVVHAALEQSPEEERVIIAEQSLQDAGQIVIDILSRYLFETALFEERAKSELSPDDLCKLMLGAQKSTYGDALDPDFLHPYMWAVKGHYYNQDLPFYNYPYAFGMLFGTALYREYLSTGDAFVDRYDELLSLTGSMSANDLTARLGFDIETEEFWSSGIDESLSLLAQLS